MAHGILLLVVVYVVSHGHSTPIQNGVNKNSAIHFISRLKGDHNIEKRSFHTGLNFYLNGGFANLVGNGGMVQMGMPFQPQLREFHSFLPYNPNHPHGHLPGEFPPPLGQQEQPFPGHMPNGGYGHHHNPPPPCDVYNCKHNDFNNFDHNHGHHPHEFDNGFGGFDCHHPDHKHMPPHHHHHKDEDGQETTYLPPHHHHKDDEGQETTYIPPIETTTPKATTAAKVTTGTTVSTSKPGPIYDIDVRFNTNNVTNKAPV